MAHTQCRQGGSNLGLLSGCWLIPVAAVTSCRMLQFCSGSHPAELCNLANIAQNMSLLHTHCRLVNCNFAMSGQSGTQTATLVCRFDLLFTMHGLTSEQCSKSAALNIAGADVNSLTSSWHSSETGDRCTYWTGLHRCSS